MALRPFEVQADDIERLKTKFTEAMNRLLQAEASAAGMRASALVLNEVEDISDGGVDASVHNAPEGLDWVPAGDSAWQFKRSNLGPKACADELEKAKWAHTYLNAGGSYIIALGKALTEKLVEDRRKKVIEKAIALELIKAKDGHRIVVLDANSLARWVSSYPTLAATRLFGGPGTAAIDFAQWSASGRHQLTWSSDPIREQLGERIRSDVLGERNLELRVQGDDGVGKTRLVMEALRGSPGEALVLYVAEASEVGGELLGHVIADGRTAILIIDKCPPDRHESLAERLPAGSEVRLVSIGPSGSVASRRPIIAVPPLAEEAITGLLETSYPQLSSDARRFVATHAAGNPRWADIMVSRVLESPGSHAADLIQRDDLDRFVSELLPEGGDFFIAAGIALFERVGWDREYSGEADLLGQFLGVDRSELDRVAVELERLGLLERHGRYRSIAPHPLAVYLASESWKRERERITVELLPDVGEFQALMLFRRLADIGTSDPAHSALTELLGPKGPFASLELMEKLGNGKLLTQLSIVIPLETTRHLAELIDAASLDDLRSMVKLRRDLVWTLEKLAWHSETFVRAADSLARLAVAEIEDYGNNATGTWASLFGTFLPATAAASSVRSSYLATVARSQDSSLRMLSIRGLRQAIEVRHERAMVSAELQGGALVESRGRPETWEEVFEYHEAALSLLGELASDSSDGITTRACEELISAIHPLAGVARPWGRLVEIISSSAHLHARARGEVAGLEAMYRRVDETADGKERSEDRASVRASMAALIEALPSPSPEEELDVLLDLHTWDFQDGELEKRLTEALVSFLGASSLEALLTRLAGEVPAAFEFGAALANAEVDDFAALRSLAAHYETNPFALRGYLVRQPAGLTGVERFLSSPQGLALSAIARLELAGIGAGSSAELSAIASEAVAALPPAIAASRVPPAGTSSEMESAIEDWLPRIATQSDYNAVVGWFSFSLHGLEETDITAELGSVALRLAARRSEFPAVRQQGWAWGRVAGIASNVDGLAIVELVLDLVEGNDLMLLGSEPEAQALHGRLVEDAETTWPLVGERLENGSWRVAMMLRDWALVGVDPRPVEAWVGVSVERARLVAPLAPIGGTEPSDYCRSLLVSFGADDEVASSLYGSLISGVWTGSESRHLQVKIDRLNMWRDSPTESPEVKAWARKVVDSLTRSQEAAREREAEWD